MKRKKNRIQRKNKQWNVAGEKNGANQEERWVQQNNQTNKEKADHQPDKLWKGLMLVLQHHR